MSRQHCKIELVTKAAQIEVEYETSPNGKYKLERRRQDGAMSFYHVVTDTSTNGYVSCSSSSLLLFADNRSSSRLGSTGQHLRQQAAFGEKQPKEARRW